MEIQEMVMKYKYLIIFTFTVCILGAVIYVAPSFMTILAYFWPLFLSTALFLAAVVFFGKTSLPGTELSGDKAGEGLLDYVAGQPVGDELVVENFKNE
ncbi:uncharacterized protein LOC8286844 [Ricinus communis]|uniref:Transmembrane protein n=1 Tax=Ricinus communis TaxID=3988 RepID=B9S9U0_RICCO|nr:uncharacterized protein LOC8286844 [Ricinus communis]EEF39610.1 conserved hypothetical protein [Ricinus communis]|eukprot:XP_002522759.1 uncharacterized protein LOC8286844 [Ricinus communis]